MSQYSWWFTPRVRAGIEFNNGELTSFEAIASGDVSLSHAFVGKATLAGVTVKRTIYELPAPKQPRYVIVTIIPGPVPVPVFATMRLNLSVKSEAQTQAVLNFTGVYQQDVSAAFGATYRKGNDIEWVNSFQGTAPVLNGDVDLAGELSFKIYLEPQLTFLVYHLAGFNAGIVPSARIVATVPVQGEAKVCVEADAKFEIKPAGPVFEALGLGGKASYTIASSRLCDQFGFTTHPESQTVDEGADVSFSCVVSSPSPAKFQWYQNGKPIPSQTGRSLFLYNVKAGYAGAYTVKAVVDGLTLESDPAILAIRGQVPDGFVLIPAGSFQMGDQSNPLVGESKELPVHSVQVSAFYMGKYEVTKELWDEVRAWGLSNGYGDLPVGASKGANHPVHLISWYAMVKWCNALSQKENLTPCYTVSGLTYKTGSSAAVCNWNSNGYRLPSEAEWEKAARGGVSGKNFPWGTDTITHSQANYYSSTSYAYDVSPTRTNHPTYAVGGSPYSSPVGSFAPNGYGLYDIAGNMWEWCWDWYSSSYYASSPGSDPRGAGLGSYRVLRGGAWGGSAPYCRVAVRGSLDPTSTGITIGFRVARSSVP